MMRIVLFLITNLAVMLLLGVIVKLFGVDTYFVGQAVGMNLNELLIMAGVFGMGGSIISLLISKWTAKRMMGLQVHRAAQRWRRDVVVRAGQRHLTLAPTDLPAYVGERGRSGNRLARGFQNVSALLAQQTER